MNAPARIVQMMPLPPGWRCVYADDNGLPVSWSDALGLALVEWIEDDEVCQEVIPLDQMRDAIGGVMPVCGAGGVSPWSVGNFIGLAHPGQPLNDFAEEARHAKLSPLKPASTVGVIS